MLEVLVAVFSQWFIVSVVVQHLAYALLAKTSPSVHYAKVILSDFCTWEAGETYLLF